MDHKSSSDSSIRDSLREFAQCKADLIAKRRAIIDLSMINPDLEPPRFVIDKLLEASMKPHAHRYAVSRGIGKLRHAFAQKYHRLFNATVSPDTEICVCMGAKDAIVNSLLCLSPKVKSVLVGAPTYPVYLAAARLAGMETGTFEISHDEQGMLREIEERIGEGKYQALILNFPNNPTGVTVSGHFYKKLLNLTRPKGVMVLNDFVYGELAYEERSAVSLLSVDPSKELIAEIYSISKAYSVPGWRVSALCGDPALVSELAQLKSQIDFGIFLPIQSAAFAAISAPEGLVHPIVQEYRLRMKHLVNGLRALGFKVKDPRAGCSVWAELPAGHFLEGANEFVLRLMREHAVVALPGTAYGSAYSRWVRFALVVSIERLNNVLSAIEQLCAVSERQAVGM